MTKRGEEISLQESFTKYTLTSYSRSVKASEVLNRAYVCREPIHATKINS